MSRKAAATLAILFTFSSASAFLADANNRTDYPGSLSQLPASIMSNSRAGIFNDAGKPFTSEKNGSFARHGRASHRVPPSVGAPRPKRAFGSN
jgi:hypothetical protein